MFFPVYQIQKVGKHKLLLMQMNHIVLLNAKYIIVGIYGQTKLVTLFIEHVTEKAGQIATLTRLLHVYSFINSFIVFKTNFITKRLNMKFNFT